MNKIQTENLAYWFFRLNGCLSLVDFLVHNRHGQEGTDVDILAVRFPYRKELALSDDTMEDHPAFEPNNKIDLILAEVKLGRAELNGPWTDPQRMNMQRVLYALGAFPPNMVDAVGQALYNQKIFEDERYRCRLFAVGKEKNWFLQPEVVQLTWEEILKFIHERFTTYEKYKSQHQQWDATGRHLFKWAVSRQYRRDPDQYVSRIMGELSASVGDGKPRKGVNDEQRQ